MCAELGDAFDSEAVFTEALLRGEQEGEGEGEGKGQGQGRKGGRVNRKVLLEVAATEFARTFLLPRGGDEKTLEQVMFAAVQPGGHDRSERERLAQVLMNLSS